MDSGTSLGFLRRRFGLLTLHPQMSNHNVLHEAGPGPPGRFSGNEVTKYINVLHSATCILSVDIQGQGVAEMLAQKQVVLKFLAIRACIASAIPACIYVREATPIITIRLSPALWASEAGRLEVKGIKWAPSRVSTRQPTIPSGPHQQHH